MAAGEAAGRDRRALLRQGQNGRDPRRFRPAEPGRVMAEIALGARICTKGADAGLGYVEIDLHDPVLAPEQFDQHREPRLQAFRSEEHTSELQSLMRLSYAV